MKIRNRKTVIAAVAALLMGVSVPLLAVGKRKR